MTLGILFILAALGWGVIVISATSMSDSIYSFNWFRLWLTYVGLGVGGYLIAAKFLPWLRLP